MQTLQQIHLSSVVVPNNRIRREFDETALRELVDSILSKGLLHPPVLRADGCTLVAGERRLRAISKIYASGHNFRCNGAVVEPGMVPFIYSSDLSDTDLREAELEENTRRRDLTWQERAAAVAELHKLRKDQHQGEFTVLDLAKEMIGESAGGYSADQVARTLRVAEHLSDPDIAQAPTEKEAIKILTKKNAATQRALLAEQFDLTKTPHTIIHDDAFARLPLVEDDSVDIIISDPPYGVDAQDFGSQAANQHEYDDREEYALHCYNTIISTAAGVLRPNGFIFLFCDIDLFSTIKSYARTYGFTPFRTPLIWDKSNGMLPWPDNGPRRTYECIFYAKQGNAKFNIAAPSDIIRCPPVTSQTFGAEKPAELYRTLLSWVANPGDVILDPFAGSGPVLAAASALKCRAIAIEQNKAKVDFMLTRGDM